METTQIKLPSVARNLYLSVLHTPSKNDEKYDHVSASLYMRSTCASVCYANGSRSEIRITKAVDEETGTFWIGSAAFDLGKAATQELARHFGLEIQVLE